MRKPVLAALALALATGTALADGTPAAIEFTSRDWTLVTLDGVAPQAHVTLNLGEPGKVSGQAPCNRFFGPVESDGMALRFGGLGATMMACEYLDEEHAFLTALGGVETALRDGDRLTLSGGGHDLVFSLAP